ncbi:MAG: 50S ribosomal protein L32 [Candidatus Moranbacteria bacterium]|nr:50S ribosomal protein L32 [Candidatus Moranbacteria bacterium]MDD5652072.1 50S ribosomal protein L32 [Candidatus Moranbacteria bacterium]MDX9855605.1 50S ribosomal protein L32 [Candidatus Moranbacteria bacterium]
MPVPKQRHNKARKGRRRAGQLNKNKIEKIKTVKCSNCESPILPHRACPECGTYKGKEVVKFSKK